MLIREILIQSKDEKAVENLQKIFKKLRFEISRECITFLKVLLKKNSCNIQKVELQRYRIVKQIAGNSLEQCIDMKGYKQID